MTSKWIRNIVSILAGELGDEDIIVTLNKIDKLLRKAMNLIDDPNLYDEIRKEITNEN